MNPNPADNQSNNTSEQGPIQKANVPQLEKETPMDITIYPSNENPNLRAEPEKVVPIQFEPVTQISSTPSEVVTQEKQRIEEPSVEETVSPLLISNTVDTISPSLTTNTVLESQVTPTQESPIAITPINPVEQVQLQEVPQVLPNADLSFGSNPLQNKSTGLQNQNIQKFAIIGGVVGGVLLVGFFSFLYIANTQNVIAPTNQDQVPAPQLKAVVPTTEVEMPIVQNLTTSEYQLKVDSLYTKYLATISKNPINLNSNVVGTETLKFVSDEIFAISSELNELNIPIELKPYNDTLFQDFQSIVNSYDELLKNYKIENALSVDMKTKFNSSTKELDIKLKATVDTIKSLQ